MKSRYRIILSNHNMYKEIELPVDLNEFKIGTNLECDFRLQKHLFFGPIELLLRYDDNNWTVFCSDSLYITVGDVRKLITKTLVHGDILQVKYQESNNTAFTFEFLVDFDYGNHNFERMINIAGVKTLTIGAESGNQICINSSYITNDKILLELREDTMVLKIINTTYGVYHDGKKAESGEIIRNGDFVSISDFTFYYKDGFLWTEANSNMKIAGLEYHDNLIKNEYPKFVRNTRIRTTVNDEKIEVLDPPSIPVKPRGNLLTRLLPSMGMLVISGAMAFMGGVMIIFSALSGGMAVVTTIVGIIDERKEFKKKSAQRIEKYNKYIAAKQDEIKQDRDNERRELEDIYISSDEELRRFDDFSVNLFDRAKDDEDFLCVRFGTGDLEAARKIDYKKQERLEVEDHLQEMPKEIYDEYKMLKSAPITCDFKLVNAIGIVGNIDNRYSMLKNIVMDIIARQYHTDIELFFVTEDKHKSYVDDFRMLPCVFNDVIGIRNFVCDDESKNIIFEYLYKEFSIRKERKAFDKRMVIFFFDEYGFKSHPISRFIDDAKDLGITFIFFSDEKKDIPQGCDYIVEMASDEEGSLIKAQDKRDVLNFKFKPVKDGRMNDIIKLVAPIYTEEISLEGTLTKSYSMFEMLNIMSVDDIDLSKRWSVSKVYESMRAPVGISKTGIVELDLHDKAHGPHGLVAGTTGSGKSEILQTYILSMATLYHPYEVGFVIIDFKGGGMVNQFSDLPHLIGAITNIDGKEIDRSLKSIKAELEKRQKYFADADVNHIDKYIKKYKAGEVSEPLPHLIIIVDEFAELKAEHPDFMKELISAARIGRSLGVHLILATQKPAGQVDDQIWSNSRFKLCLKVQSPEDSNEVLKSPLAAEIKEPGRAYLQVGNNEIFELFQSAYSGAPEKIDDSHVKEFSIYELTTSGRRKPVFVQKKKKKSNNEVLTQLDSIVNYVNGYCESNGIKKLPNICLPSLKHVINFDEKQDKNCDSTSIIADIGIYDDPDTQFQGIYSVNLSDENMMIIGSSQSGKTNMLQTIIRSVSSKYSPKEVNIYIIDFASMVLKNFESLNHVGGVVTPSEDEKLKNLIKLLLSEIDSRKEKLLSVGVSSFSSYREAGKKDLPQILLIIDNLTALKEVYFQDDDVLLNLCREGLAVGITIIIANSQTNGIGYKYLSNFSSRVALFCNDSGEYGSLFDHCRETIDDIHGRCLIEIDKNHLDCQSYLAFEGEKEIDRVTKIKEYIEKINSKYIDIRAKMIPVIPKMLTDNYVLENYRMFMQQKFSIVVGLDYDTVVPFTFKLSELGMIAISGREQSGKHNFIKYVVQTVDNMYSGSVDIFIVDGIKRKLGSLKNLKSVKKYTVLPEDGQQMVSDIEMQLKDRYDLLAAGDESVIEKSNLLLLIINNIDSLEVIGNDSSTYASYKNILSRYKNLNVCVIVSDIDNAAISYSSPEIVKNIRDLRHFLFFEDINNMKIFDMPLAVVRKYKKPIELGDCYYIKENYCLKIKTVLETKEL